MICASWHGLLIPIDETGRRVLHVEEFKNLEFSMTRTRKKASEMPPICYNRCVPNRLYGFIENDMAMAGRYA